MPDILPDSEDNEPTEVQRLLGSLADYRLRLATLDFLGYQYSGNGLSRHVRPHPHAGCLDRIINGT